jgi:hypothetical protein
MSRLQRLKSGAPYEDLGRYALAINEIMEGATNAFGTLTLTANAASTTVTDPNFRASQYVMLIPLTANAAAALATTYQNRTGLANGSFVLAHANNAQTDKTFAYMRFG